MGGRGVLSRKPAAAETKHTKVPSLPQQHAVPSIPPSLKPVNFFSLPFLLFFDGSRFSLWKGRPVSVCSVMTRQPRESTHVWATGRALITGGWPSAEIWTAFIGDAIWTTQDPRREPEKRRQRPSPLSKTRQKSAKGGE